MREIRLMVVEDEPAAMKHICTLIQNYCPGFRIVDECENGGEALEHAAAVKPELVLTDIKMPGINGIELITELRKLLPDTETILMSGFQEFEYAKSAILHGVIEYMLKPLSPKAVAAALQTAAVRISRKWYESQKRLITRIASQIDVPASEAVQSFPESRYYLAVSRKNGLIRRFQSICPAGRIERELSGREFYGRDDKEIIYVCPSRDLTYAEFVQHISANPGDMEDDFYTTVAMGEICDTAELPIRIRSLLKHLDSSITIGKNQFLTVGSKTQSSRENEDSLKAYDGIVKDFEYCTMVADISLTKKHLMESLSLFEKEERSQLWVESIVWRIFFVLMKKVNAPVSHIEMENMLEEAFFYSNTYSELGHNLNFVIDCMQKNDTALAGKIDSEEYFDQIMTFVARNMTEQISLQSVCDVFHISQPYMSRLFRKYAGASFSKVINKLRIEAAVKMMGDNKNIHIKDIAVALGFSDQFYFSKVFKTVMDCSPSEYLKKAENGLQGSSAQQFRRFLKQS
jgi:two-component system response regulator YesN